MRYQSLPDWRILPELSRLLDLPHPPKQLFYKGEWSSSLFHQCVAIIGSRRMTDYGRRVIEMIVPKLVFEKKTIVSGFMYGADQYAHKLCVENGGRTIAVLGWGISNVLEDYDKKLGDAIVDSGGLLLSEWEHQKATLWTFPVRNRIVAALSSDVIVVEATIKSGSLITANIAQKLKRNLWAVPGPITSNVSKATNELIAFGKAKMWLGETIETHSDNPLVKLLENEALTANDIARKTGANVDTIGAQLSLLTVTGELFEQGGKYYVSKN